MIASTLTLASQNSTSPKVRTEMAFAPMKIAMSTSDHVHDGRNANQLCSVSPPSTAS